MNKKLLIVILVIAAIFAAYYFGTQQPRSADPVNISAASATFQLLSRSSVTEVVKPTATKKPAATKTPSKAQTYILNKNTKKFHYLSCSSVKQMKESNMITVTKTREEIIADGYEPCGRCHP